MSERRQQGRRAIGFALLALVLLAPLGPLVHLAGVVGESTSHPTPDSLGSAEGSEAPAPLPHDEHRCPTCQALAGAGAFVALAPPSAAGPFAPTLRDRVVDPLPVRPATISRAHGSRAPPLRALG